ncbi:15-hydroxyprostaglandin dehydrogenase [NAD(+)]-like [Liolophura sinensis]|uniref:15-hydroxyprostaglandin dehydrogenase [NAD(+)]-like n=1 Tax=Liolophura sinensis TaxID=3198878 RepID=UPI0031585B6D
MAEMIVTGKVALIAGAAKGMGLAISQSFLERGAQVCLADINLQALQSAAKDLRDTYGYQNVTYYECDVTEKYQFQAAFHHTKFYFKGLFDIVVNAAAVINADNWERNVQVNLGGVINGTEIAFDFMNEQGGGVIVNIGSIAGVRPWDYHMVPVYAAAKAAVVAYTQSFAKSRGALEKGIRMTCVCPAPTGAEIMADESEMLAKLDVVDAILTKERAKPEEVAKVTMRLVEDDESNGIVAVMDAPKKVDYRHYDRMLFSSASDGTGA